MRLLIICLSIILAGCGSASGSGSTANASSGSRANGGTSGAAGNAANAGNSGAAGNAANAGNTAPAWQPGNFQAAAQAVRPRFFATATGLGDGRVLLAGGLEDASFFAGIPLPTATTELYDPLTDTFSAGTPMATFRFSHRALPVGGDVLLLGGDLAGSVERFDPATGSFSPGGQLRQPRIQFTATQLASGEILCTGGLRISLSTGLGGTPLADTELYDPLTGQSRPGPTLPAPRFGHSAVTLPGGEVLLLGGSADTATVIFDPVSEQLLPGPPLVQAREDQRAVRLGDGRVLVSGGSDPSGTSLASAELLDVGALAFRALGTMPGGGREDHSCTLLADGRVLIAGGEDNGAGPNGADLIVPSALVFDPASESFSALGNTLVPRDDHAATRLPDGSVLLTGGEDVSGQGIRAAERYVP